MKITPARALGLALISLWPTVAAHAAGGEISDEPASTLELVYRLYIGGIPLGQVDFSTRLRGDSYTAASTLETVGVANALWEAKLEATSYGSFRELDLRPTNYDAFSIHEATRGVRQQVTLAYTGGLPSVTPNPDYREPVTLEDHEMQDTVDPVSALVLAVTRYEAHSEEPCAVVAPVFDGRRRYTVTLDFERNRDVTMDNGLYSGEVQICKLNYKPIAGAPQNVFEGDDVPEIFLWLTTVQSSADPDRHYVLPLRLWSETDFGIIVSLLTSVRLDGVEQSSLN
ncbi:MAG: DUF3108 domain-containing protein [Alphaproteobacteria bacterium]